MIEHFQLRRDQYAYLRRTNVEDEINLMLNNRRIIYNPNRKNLAKRKPNTIKEL